MVDRLSFYIALTALAVSTALFVAYAFARREAFARTAKVALIGSVTFHVLTMVIHVSDLASWHETLSFFSLVIVIVYLMIQSAHDIPILGAFITPLALVAMAGALRSPGSVSALPFQSTLLSAHVHLMFIAYAAFANAFGVGIVYLLQEHQLKSRKPSNLVFRLPALDELDQLIFRIIVLALPVLTLGLFFGARWAHDVWGRYWGWDPKETAAFITWLIYVVYLIARLGLGWRGRKTAYLSLLGFLIVLLTYVGVNYVSPLHSFLSRAGR